MAGYNLTADPNAALASPLGRMFVPQLTAPMDRFAVAVPQQPLPTVSGPAPQYSSLPAGGAPQFRAIEAPGAQQNGGGPPPPAPGQQNTGGPQAGVPEERGGRIQQFVDDHPRVPGMVRTFAASGGQLDRSMGPFEAFASGFSNALNAGSARRSAMAEAEADAEQTAYDRGRDALEDQRYDDETAYDRGRDAVEDRRANEALIADLRRSEYLNLYTEAQINDLLEEAETTLTPDQLLRLDTNAINLTNALLDSFDWDAMDEDVAEGIREEVRTEVAARRAQAAEELMRAARGEDPFAAPAAGVPREVPDEPTEPFPATGRAVEGLDGMGTQAAPYTPADDAAYALVPIGGTYRDPGDGVLYRKR